MILQNWDQDFCWGIISNCGARYSSTKVLVSVLQDHLEIHVLTKLFSQCYFQEDHLAKVLGSIFPASPHPPPLGYKLKLTLLSRREASNCIGDGQNWKSRKNSFFTKNTHLFNFWSLHSGTGWAPQAWTSILVTTSPCHVYTNTKTIVLIVPLTLQQLWQLWPFSISSRSNHQLSWVAITGDLSQ